MKIMNIVRKTVLTALFAAAAVQASGYLITWITPPTKIDTSVVVRIDFMKTGLVLDDSFTVYFGTQTGGGIPANYPSKASFVFKIDSSTIPVGANKDTVVNRKADSLANRPKNIHTDDGACYTKADSLSLTKRSIYITPRHQMNGNGQKTMLAGRFYFIIKGNKGGTSQEAQMIVETKEAATLLTPKGTITSMQPVFKWSTVPGVPYYHLLLSDQVIDIDLDGGGLSNASFIWQAIVPGGEIQYGSPDPSGIFPPPPPLSPDTGTKYQWLVLNNYGNQKEYTSVNAIPIPADFKIQDTTFNLTAPDTSTMKTRGDSRNLNSFFDSTGKLVRVDTFKVGSSDSGKITLSWGKINNANANLYRVYLYNVLYDSTTKSDAAIAVWTRSTTDTFVTLAAKSFLADSVLHIWKVFVENTSGAGIASDKKAFFYNDTAPKAIIRYRSYERVGSTDSVVIKFANVSITPLSGGGLPIDIPTDQNGYGSKTVQYGSYRVVMNPQGYQSETRDVTLSSSKSDTTLTFVLTPYPAQIFGKVADSGNPVGDALVEAVSATGDTISANTDASGSFSLRVNSGDYLVTASKLGYRRSNPPLQYSLSHGSSQDAGTLNISRYTNLISGTVRNQASNAPIINAVVTLRRNSIVVGEQRSSDVGAYSFSVEPGTGYAVTVERQGFSTASRSDITLTTNVVYDAYLSSSTGSLAGTAYVTSHIVTATTSQYVTNGRQGVVITAINADGDTAATVESNRGDNTFLMTLIPGTYKLRCNADGVIPDSISNVVIVENQTTNQDVRLREYGRILGRVYAKTTGVNSTVDVTARHSSGITQTVQTSQSTGDYTISALIPGVWNVTFSKNGFTSKSVSRTIVDTTLSGSVKAVTSRYVPVDSLLPGTLKVKFALSLLDSTIAADNTQTVKVISPSPQSIAYGDSLTSLGAGNYVFGTTINDTAKTHSANEKILDIDSLGKALTAGATISLPHPFKHITTANADTSRDSVTLKLIIKGGSFTSANVLDATAKIYYRDQSSNTWKSDALKRKSGDSLVFLVRPTNDNSSMVYYFDVKGRYGTDTLKWSNRLSPFSTFVPASSGIKYMMIFPSAWDAATPASIPWKTTSEFTLICQNGAFKEVPPTAIQWTAANKAGKVTFTGNQTSVLKATVTGDSTIDETAVDTISCKVTFNGRDTTIKTFYKIAKQDIDLIVITPSVTSISSGQKASFLMAGMNLSSGRLFPVRGKWGANYTFPSGTGIDSITGEFTAPLNFIGTVKVRAEAYGKRAFYSLPIKHQIKAADTSFAYDAASESDAGLILRFGKGVYPSGTGRDLVMASTALSDLPVLKAITSRGQIVTSAYLLTLGNSTSAMPSDSFSMVLRIPEKFRGKEIFPVVWNQQKIQWDIIDTSRIRYLNTFRVQIAKLAATAIPNGAAYIKVSMRSFGPVSGNGVSGEYALMTPSETFGIRELKIGPNPFSPLVMAKDSVGNRWQGLRIEYFVNTDQSSQSYSEVQILNMEGNIVNSKLLSREETATGFEPLYSLNSKGGFYGRRTLKRVYIWDGTNNNGRMCRNGRYLVRIHASDGTSTQYRTIPVTLFK
ncbi:MAG: carboxypeptidase regulatory-like domain-containing protein [Fibrobacteres bacterium]|nr:carboxypeptidase regulatory-like domain-containing protein [Fibrobacterota bacterium]